MGLLVFVFIVQVVAS